MNNYRVTYHHDLPCNYWAKKGEKGPSFREWSNLHYPLISKIIETGKKKYSIKYIWFFYEPYVEITWLDDQKGNSERFIRWIRSVLKKEGIKDAKFLRPKNGPCGDWFCTTEREREFGAKRHALCQEWIALYNEYKDVVDSGKGLDAQVDRTIHTLCNPLGLNYKDEYKICFRHGIGCWLFWHFPEKVARWIGKNILRRK